MLERCCPAHNMHVCKGRSEARPVSGCLFCRSNRRWQGGKSCVAASLTCPLLLLAPLQNSAESSSSSASAHDPAGQQPSSPAPELLVSTSSASTSGLQSPSSASAAAAFTKAAIQILTFSFSCFPLGSADGLQTPDRPSGAAAVPHASSSATDP